MQTRGLLVLLTSKAAGAAVSSTDLSEVMVGGIYPSQRTLAEITEMIHTAALIHKGVIDIDDLNSSLGSADEMKFGNKMAILSGDFMLANASVGLAGLNNSQVVELISSAIEDIMKSEFLLEAKDPGSLPTIDDWERYTFLSTGSLVAKSCKAAMLLAHHDEDMQQAVFNFAKQISFAHKISDDLQSVLHPKDGSTVDRMSLPYIVYINQNLNSDLVQELQCTEKFSNKKLLKAIKNADILDECRQLCHQYGDEACTTLDAFSRSDAKHALTNILRAITSI